MEGVDMLERKEIIGLKERLFFDFVGNVRVIIT